MFCRKAGSKYISPLDNDCGIQFVQHLDIAPGERKRGCRPAAEQTTSTAQSPEFSTNTWTPAGVLTSAHSRVDFVYVSGKMSSATQHRRLMCIVVHWLILQLFDHLQSCPALHKSTMPAETKIKTSTTAHWRRLISTAISLMCGIFITGRLHIKQWAHELVRYQTGSDNDALVSIVYETVYLLLRILVGGYGSYAVFRDLISPMFREQARKEKAV